MNFPLFIFHEMIIRLGEINPLIGRYASHLDKGDVFIISTTKGLLIVPTHFLEMQTKDASLISKADLNILASNFKPDHAAAGLSVK